MKITFAKQKPAVKTSKTLFISVSSDNKDEIMIENGVKTLHLRSDKKDSITKRKLVLLVRKMVILAKSHKVESIVFDLNDFKFSKVKLSGIELGEIVGSHLDFANYEYNVYKTPPEGGFPSIKEAIIFGEISQDEKEGLKKGITIGEEVNKTRDLSNTPGGDMTPTILAQKAKETMKGLPVKVTVLGEKEMKAIKMNAVLSVGKGSEEESKFIIMEYGGGKTSEKPIVLVGKGVTFDTGGINLKPSNGLLGMNMDMSGGASVIHTVALAARLKIKKNIIGLVPSVENMNSGSSYRPGDVIRSMSGKTIEVLNTDAEGRVILADALTYATRFKPEVVVDIATLTGAALVALGERASAIFTKDDSLSKILEESGEYSGDYVWRLPLWEEYENDIKGSLGDYTNIHNKSVGYGGAINGAIFLYQFAKDYKWAHIDMAPRMTSISGDYLAPGATGTPVRLLLKLIEEYK